MKAELKINASFLSGSACSLRNYFILIASLDTKNQIPIEIQFGSAFHQFASTIIKSNGNFGHSLMQARAVQALPCHVGYNKDYMTSPAYLTNVVTDWWDWYQESNNFEILVVDGEPLVEKSFKLKVFEDEYLIIWLCGTIDKIGKFKNGAYGIGDYKTTSKPDKSVYFDQYRLRVQLRTYLYAIQQHGILYPDSVFAKMSSTPLVAFIEGIFLTPPSKGSMASFQKSDMFQAKDMGLDEYERLLQQKIHELVNMWRDYNENKIIPERVGMLEGLCDYCKFAPICANKHNPILEQAVIKQHYITKLYDPMTFGSKELIDV